MRLVLAVALTLSTLTSPSPVVVYIGDSVGAQNAPALAAALTPATFHDLTLGGTAICDYLADSPTWLPPSAKLDTAIRTLRPDLVVLQFWGNDFWSPCANDTRRGTDAFYDRYFWNALSARREISAAADAAGIPRPAMLWVLQAPSPDREIPRRLNEIYSYVAELSGDRVSDAGATVVSGDRYAFTRFVPCTPAELGTPSCTEPSGTTRVHADSDDIHFCPSGTVSRGCDGPAPGIDRYVARISLDAKSWLGGN
ncbi:hypothetical protein FKR81_31775 [Lentzea tibetensis]|uniref:SGNH/GDSL hydrolase family protein n=1 Tax=Lentzea tibetensis TaxID=2591470 RepID=A0A563EKS6_9PSEU|nr:hypothetical protein [Lentzea tibetensis]TWP47544.1 hypothetical protein FKR81_31775 [Lentzea tibetensis]